jgi:lysyl endopeptidase
MRGRILIGVSLLCACVATGARAVAVPPAVYQPASTAKESTAPRLLSAAGTREYQITLQAPPATLKRRAKPVGSAGKTSARQGNKGRPLQIGFARDLPDGQRPLYLEALQWQTLADGGKAARVSVTSPSAAAVRLGLVVSKTDPDVSLRFAGSGGQKQVFGPVPANKAAAAKLYWSPVLEGDKATLEIYLPAGVVPGSVQIAIPQISHLVVAGSDLSKAEPTSDIGTSDSCEMDVACVATPAILNQAKAVAKMLFTDAGDTFICTGTLINDSIHSNTAYFYTANHCMDSQEAASTLVTYWFFDAATCGSRAVPPYQTVAGGAMLLGRSIDSDWALLRLNSPPPANAVFSAWRADAMANATPISVLHHPQGDLKKFSRGTMTSYHPFDDGSSFATAQYTLGSTEGGSSGSGLLTLATGGSFYELRGGLFGGAASCSNPTGNDYYSRLDVALPLVAQYLTPDATNPQNKTVVVEYYDAALDDYFITADKSEIQGLDNGVHPGWVRTGLTFLAYSDAASAPADASPVCRFYVSPQYGDSHFYSADPAECAATATAFAGKWIEESAALFYIQIPNKTTGACPTNTRPVYRFLNKANQIHHRYTAEVDERNCLFYGNDANFDEPESCPVTSGQWTLEGYGNPPTQTVMCSPTS